MKRHILKCLSLVLVIAMALCAVAVLGVSAEEVAVENENVAITLPGTYNLFNSGCENAYGTSYDYSYPLNPAENTFTNNGYDIYVDCCNGGAANTDYAQLGLSFLVKNTITEKVTISINAYDVDESSGETDEIYLVDETDGTSVHVGTLSGMDSEWNNTTFDVAPALYKVGHTYHYQLIGRENGWVVYVRTVAMIVNGADLDYVPEDGEEVPVIKQPVTDISAAVGISTSGQVSAAVTLYAEEYTTFNVEVKVTHADTNNQVASDFGTVYASPEGYVNTFTMYLGSGASSGTYRIDAYVKNASGDVVKSVATVAGYISFAVAYNANGGSQNLPMDYTAYYEGDTVTIRYDYVPSKTGYTFLGWSTNSNAATPEYAAGEDVTLTMDQSDVTLYAVWEETPGGSIIKPPASGNKPITNSRPPIVSKPGAETEVETEADTTITENETLTESEVVTDTATESTAATGGCSGAIGFSALAVIFASGMAVVLRKKD